jgi:hypothetical protein
MFLSLALYPSQSSEKADWLRKGVIYYFKLAYWFTRRDLRGAFGVIRNRGLSITLE